MIEISVVIKWSRDYIFSDLHRAKWRRDGGTHSYCNGIIEVVHFFESKDRIPKHLFNANKALQLKQTSEEGKKEENENGLGERELEQHEIINRIGRSFTTKWQKSKLLFSNKEEQFHYSSFHTYVLCACDCIGIRHCLLFCFVHLASHPIYHMLSPSSQLNSFGQQWAARQRFSYILIAVAGRWWGECRRRGTQWILSPKWSVEQKALDRFVHIFVCWRVILIIASSSISSLYLMGPRCRQHNPIAQQCQRFV